MKVPSSRDLRFWDSTQRRMVVPYGRFGITCWLRLQGSSSPRPLKMGPKVGPKRRYGFAILPCVKSQKSAYLICIAEDAWNHGYYPNIFAWSDWGNPRKMCAAVFDVCTNAFIATCYRVDGSRQNPGGGKRLLLITSVHTDPRSHPASCTYNSYMFPWVKAAGAWRWPPTSSAEVKNV